MTKLPTMIGILLLVAGLLGFAIPIFTTQQTTDVARLGDLKVQATETRTHVVPPLLAGGAIVVGIVLLIAGTYRSRP